MINITELTQSFPQNAANKNDQEPPHPYLQNEIIQQNQTDNSDEGPHTKKRRPPPKESFNDPLSSVMEELGVDKTGIFVNKPVEFRLLEFPPPDLTSEEILEEAMENPKASLIFTSSIGSYAAGAQGFTTLKERSFKLAVKAENSINTADAFLQELEKTKVFQVEAIHECDIQIEHWQRLKEQRQQELAKTTFEIKQNTKKKHDSTKRVFLGSRFAALFAKWEDLADNNYSASIFGEEVGAVDDIMTLADIQKKVGLQSWTDILRMCDTGKKCIAMLRLLFHGGLQTNQGFKGLFSCNPPNWQYGSKPKVLTQKGRLVELQHRIADYLQISVDEGSGHSNPVQPATPPCKKELSVSLEDLISTHSEEEIFEIVKQHSAKKRKRDEF